MGKMASARDPAGEGIGLGGTLWPQLPKIKQKNKYYQIIRQKN
jgi:hypothetical protein